MEPQKFSPREVNEMAARFHHLLCSVCGAELDDCWWAGQDYGGPLFFGNTTSPNWDERSISIFCKAHRGADSSLR